MNKSIGLLLCSFVLLLSCQKKEPKNITYHISESQFKGAPALKISFQVEAVDTSEATSLFFQDTSWGEDSLYNTLSDISIVDGKGTIEMDRDSNRIVIHHPKNTGVLEVEYLLHQDTELPLDARKTYRPVIQPEYFSIYAHNMFMIPEHLKDTFDVSLFWEGFGDKYTIHNSFGSESRNQELKNMTRDKFHSAIFTGGDYRIHSMKIKNHDAFLAIRGEWKSINDDQIIELLTQTLRAQRNFWQDHSQSYFTITMLPFPYENGTSVQGTGLTNSFAVSASNNEFLDLERLAYLFNHELMHNWIGHTIQNEQEELQYWFSEGFTEYYTFKNIAENHILGLDREYFLKEMNNIIVQLYTSPVRNQPNSNINYTNFWSNYDYEKLPYYRGALYAFYLDLTISQKTNKQKNLNDLMQLILADAKGKDQKINSSYFVSKVKELTGEDITATHNNYIENGDLIDLKALFNMVGLESMTGAKTRYLGYSKDAENYITEIDAESEAYKAGLRQGDKLTGWSIYAEPDKEATIKRLRNGVESTLNFYPAKILPIEQLELTTENQKKLW